jgi:hypothetical protein
MRLNESTLQRIRTVVAKRRPGGPLGAVRLDRIDEPTLHAHVAALIRRGELDGEIEIRDGLEYARVRGPLTEKGQRALDAFRYARALSREAAAAAASDSAAALARRLRRIALVLAFALAVTGLWLFLSPAS